MTREPHEGLVLVGTSPLLFSIAAIFWAQYFFLLQVIIITIRPSEIAVLYRNNADINDLLPHLGQNKIYR